MGLNRSAMAWLVLLLTGLAETDASARVTVWNGQPGSPDRNWSTPANWTNGVPGADAIAVFGSDATGDSTVDEQFPGAVEGLIVNTGYTGSVSLQRNLTVTGLASQHAGTIKGSGRLQVTVGGRFSWTGGTMAGPGSTEIAPNATMSISGAGIKTLDGRRLVNRGRVTWTPPGEKREGLLTLKNGAVIESGQHAWFTIDGSQEPSATMVIDGNGETEPRFLVQEGGAFISQAGAVTMNSPLPTTAVYASIRCVRPANYRFSVALLAKANMTSGGGRNFFSPRPVRNKCTPSRMAPSFSSSGRVTLSGPGTIVRVVGEVTFRNFCQTSNTSVDGTGTLKIAFGGVFDWLGGDWKGTGSV